LLEWPENVDIRDNTPRNTWLPSNAFLDGCLEQMHALHALPEGWYDLSYPIFGDRRHLMADIIRRGFRSLK